MASFSEVASAWISTRMIFALICLAFTSIGSLVSTVYMEQLVKRVIIPATTKDTITGIAPGLTPDLRQILVGLVIMMVVVYTLVVLTSFLYTRIMATVTQGTLYHLRTDMFEKMQTLPIKYFDTHAHGDIMSNYTNDTDATRQLIGQSIPTLLSSSFSLRIIIIMLKLFQSTMFQVRLRT